MSRHHLTVDTVADHLEDLLSEQAAAAAERHLSRCIDCAGIRADLVALREVLAVVPADPMPEAVAVRIDVALADAWEDLNAARAAVSATRTDLSATTSDLATAEADLATADLATRRQGTPRPRKRRLVPVFAAAAGTIGVVFAAVIIGPQLATTGGDDDAGTAAQPYVSGREDSGGERALTDGGAESDGQTDAPGAAFQPPINVSQSGRDYTAYTLSQGVGEQLAAPAEATADPQDDRILLAAPGQPLAPFADGGPRVRVCIRELAMRDVEPIVVDLGTFAGDPAVIIVLPDDTDPASATAWAVDANCGAGAFETFAMVPTPNPAVVAVPTPSAPPTVPSPSLTDLPRNPTSPSTG